MNAPLYLATLETRAFYEDIIKKFYSIGQYKGIEYFILKGTDCLLFWEQLEYCDKCCIVFSDT